MTPAIMANQRRKGVERITLTIDATLLQAAEKEAALRGVDRLAVIREALAERLTPAQPKLKGEKKKHEI